MRLPVDRRFLDEVERFELRASCAACVYLEPESGRCSEGYPNDEHLALPDQVGQSVCFCKKFELL